VPAASSHPAKSSLLYLNGEILARKVAWKDAEDADDEDAGLALVSMAERRWLDLASRLSGAYLASLPRLFLSSRKYDKTIGFMLLEEKLRKRAG